MLGFKEEIEARLKLAEKCLREGEELMNRDIVQACEKLYKSIEEIIKTLAVAEELDEVMEAKRRGKWTVALLGMAAKKLSERINEKIYDAWTHTYFIHVEGFHEARLKPEQIKARLRYVKELVDIAKKHLRFTDTVKNSA